MKQLPTWWWWAMTRASFSGLMGTQPSDCFLGAELWDEGMTDRRKARIAPDILPAQWAAHSDERELYTVHRELSAHLAEWLTIADFDIGVFSARATTARWVTPSPLPASDLGVPPTTPMVPVILNTYYQPNVPSAARCWDLGVALRAALEAWQGRERIALVASGGLSHFVINEELDRRVLGGLAAGDRQVFEALPRKILRSGNSEILNWIVVGGALSDSDFDLVGYMPGYRSPAGTGCGMAFATWTPQRSGQ